MHHTDLAVPLVEHDQRNPGSADELPHRHPEPRADPVTAGDGIGNPKCAVMKDTTCPGVCKIGT